MTTFQTSEENSADFQINSSEVVEIAQRLIQFDTSNYGVLEADVETEAAKYVLALLEEVGYEPEWIEPLPGRPSIVLRIPGSDPNLGGLLIHGHLDVVPAIAEDWDVDPFSGEIIDGVLWGRGAVDMKNMDAMILTLVREIARNNWQPKRDIVIAMLADEEAGGKIGAQWLVENRPELFKGITHAISEVGGYNTYVDGKRVYLLQTAEKGLTWYRLRAEGRAGHGSQVNPDNAITKLATAISEIGQHEWPLQLSETVTELLTGVAELTGLPFDPDDLESINALVEKLGSAKTFVGATLRTGSNPTQLDGGYKVNVIPQSATAGLDVRQIPGTEAEVHQCLQDLAPEVTFEKLHHDDGIEYPFAGECVEAMIAALQDNDPEAKVLPYMLSAGTDNKAFGKLGIQGYGFAPVQLPEEFDFPAMFHAKNERIPLSSLHFGTKVLWDFVKSYAG
ncbi:MAG: M20/M25/M40 family metallo-hydrolase [Arcanobacterium sp.]|nr:M20/M25/M40 family metallo-hydrolase [Arcanobacterium sp.]